MLTRYHLSLPAVLLSLSVSATADINLTNGADINMNGSGGSTIIFQDGSTQNTSSSTNPIPAGHGGTGNTVTGTNSFVGGGLSNTASGYGSTVGGGSGSIASGDRSTVGGGQANVASSSYTTVGGGFGNEASRAKSTVGGGSGNIASGDNATVGGGYNNTASDYYATVGGGIFNEASDDYATVGGGAYNDAQTRYSTIAGGGPSDTGNPTITNNRVTDDFGTIGGGGYNQAGDNAGGTTDATYATVGGGLENTASDYYATVPGGYKNVASNDFAFAAGRDANATHANSFVWGGVGGGSSFGANTFNVHSGEIYLNGSVYHSSDRNLKEGFTAIDAKDVLSKVLDIPITTWRFKSEDDSITHIGPVAQDFMGSFGYGSSDKHITSTDADGVALAAIQGLNQKLEQKQAEIDSLREQFASLEQRLVAMEASMN